MEFGKRHGTTDTTDFWPLQLIVTDLFVLWTFYGKVANLLRTCYGETGVMDFVLYAASTCMVWFVESRNVVDTTPNFLLPGAAELSPMMINLVLFRRRGCGGCLLVQLSASLRPPRLWSVRVRWIKYARDRYVYVSKKIKYSYHSFVNVSFDCGAKMGLKKLGFQRFLNRKTSKV